MKTFKSIYYTSIPSRTAGICLTSNFTLDSFKFFVSALDRTFNFYINRTNFNISAINCLLLFIATYSVNNSKAVEYLNYKRKELEIPQFLFVIISKISSEVRTKNKLDGWINGYILPADNLTTILESLNDLSSDELKALFIGTPFANLFIDKRSAKELHSLLHVSIQNLLSHGTDFDIFIALLNELKNPSTMFRKDFPMFSGNIATYVSSAFGIYRFRNGDNHNTFHCQQSSCESLSDTTFDFFHVFFSNIPSYILSRFISNVIY